MPLYESTLITRQDMSRGDITKMVEEYSDIITKAGGKIIKNEYWGLRTLAYRVNKSRKGHYTMLGIDASPAAIKEMGRNISISEDVLRNLTIKVDELSEEPSVMMQQMRRSDEHLPKTSSAPVEKEEEPTSAEEPAQAETFSDKE